MSPHTFQRRPAPIALPRLAATLLCAGAALCHGAALAADVPAPGDDFFGFANSAWVASTVIPPGTASWGVRAQLRDDNLKEMATLFEHASSGAPGTSAAARRAGDFYMAQMNGPAIEAKGMAPIRPLLDRIAAIDSTRDLSHFLGTTLRNDADPVNFGGFDCEHVLCLWVAPSLHDPKHHMAYLLQGGLGLIGPEPYLGSDPASTALLDDYRRYIAGSLERAGVADAQAKAGLVVELETRLARTHANREASLDLAKTDQVWRRADFAVKAAGMDWAAYFAGAGMPGQKSFGAWQPDAIKGISALVASVPLDTWKAYLSFHALNENARFLPLADSYFSFYDPIFLGPGQHSPLWDHAVNQTIASLPGAGQSFVERHLSARAKASAQAIVNNLVAAFDRRIGQLAWMTPRSRTQARGKLKAMVIGIGAPDKAPDNSGLDIRPDDPYGNMQRTSLFSYRQQLAKLGRPVDRKEWIVNAEVFGINPMPLQNAMTIPVTELQAPLFDPDANEADNYAGFGVRVGRFLAQAFDDKGSRFDAQGRVRNWWSQADREQFARAAAPVVAQYAGYAPFPDVHLNGQLSLTDNIADQAGLLAAYDAFQMARAARHDADSGQLAAQRFFASYARSMRAKSSDAALRGQAVGSPQAPAPYRVAAVRNLDAWYAAFGVAPGQALYLAPEARVRIW
jgi:putative endopeptidase